MCVPSFHLVYLVTSNILRGHFYHRGGFVESTRTFITYKNTTYKMFISLIKVYIYYDQCSKSLFKHKIPVLGGNLTHGFLCQIDWSRAAPAQQAVMMMMMIETSRHFLSEDGKHRYSTINRRALTETRKRDLRYGRRVITALWRH